MEIFPENIAWLVSKPLLMFLISYLGGFITSFSVQTLVERKLLFGLLIGVAGAGLLLYSYQGLPLELAPYMKWLWLAISVSGFFRINIFEQRRYRY